MQHETATVKKVIKKYTVKNGVEKESISYNVKLNANSEFDDGDNVAVVLLDDFKDLDNVSADEIQQLKNSAADKDETIAANNERIDKLNAELKSKLNLINDVTAKFKASEKTVAELESDVSAKDDIIAELKSDIKVANATIKDHEKNIETTTAELDSTKKAVAENDKTIAELSAKNNELHLRLNELTDLLSDKDETIAALDKEIVDYKIKIAEFNAVDIDKLKEKADKSDDVKDELIEVTKKLDNKSNVISLLQNQIMELQQLVNYKDKEIDALENKGALDWILNRDVTADIDSPTLFLIDSSGNLIKENPDIDVDAADISDDPDNNDSGKDRIFKI